MDIKAILSEIKAELPQTTQLVAVSKFHPAEAIKEAYDAGQRIFGESKVQELEEKHNILPHDIQWHFIGHLQTNKVKYIAPYISMIHAVDSYKLLAEINKQAAKADRIIPCLLEIHIAQEETKFGFTPEKIRIHSRRMHRNAQRWQLERTEECMHKRNNGYGYKYR